MAALFRILLSRLAPILVELLRHFGLLFVRGFIWYKVARFGVFMIKVGVLVFLLTALVNGIEQIGNGLTASLPPMLADGIGRILPDNFYTCVTAILTAKFLVFVFELKSRLLSMTGDI